jgi:phage/plasmid primase-like uncharacterized protein
LLKVDRAKALEACPEGKLKASSSFGRLRSVTAFNPMVVPTVIAAMDASNLQPVALALRAQDPKAPILICGDNDYRLGDGDRNVGIHKAQAAAQAVGGRAAIPRFLSEERRLGDSDWNDMGRRRGLPSVRHQIEAPLLAMQAEKDNALAPPLELATAPRPARQSQESSRGLER